jgi:hypothetical protein
MNFLLEKREILLWLLSTNLQIEKCKYFYPFKVELSKLESSIMFNLSKSFKLLSLFIQRTYNIYHLLLFAPFNIFGNLMFIFTSCVS